MLFQTWIFAVFFLVFYPVYLLVKGTRLRLPWLLAASYVFYGWLSPVYLVWLVYATVVDYLAVLGNVQEPPQAAVAVGERGQ